MQLADFILSLPPELAPLRTLAERLNGDDCCISGDAITLSHRPRIGPQAFALSLYRPLPKDSVVRYEDMHLLKIPERYATLLSSLNGAFAFRLSLFGLPTSMIEGLLSRSVQQPYDLATANKHWKFGYSVPAEWFHFGGGPYSSNENIGYFLDETGKIHSARKNGVILASWQSFQAFLNEELTRAESIFPEHETFMASLRGASA